MNSPSATQALVDAGVSIWLDDLSRSALSDGRLAALIQDANVSGVTTNPTIFHTAITDADDYTDALRELAQAGATAEESVFALTTQDVSDACTLFHDVWKRSSGLDGRVSIEVDPRLAREPAATIIEAKRLFNAVNRPNVLIKIPATEEGLAAIEATIADGISVNVTLIFSLDRYEGVIRAYQAGLRKALASGHDIAQIHSVASFFVSRVDAEIDAQLDAIDDPIAAALKGKAGIANARLAFELYETLFSTEQWTELEAAGGQRQRPLWASTGVKNPNYPDTMYVTELVAPGVVNTMPHATIAVVQDHAIIRGSTIIGTFASAREVLYALDGLGISYDEVVNKLELEGLAKFDTSWTHLLADITRRLTVV